MATTTNYGWETPDDTDLVKDGASAIRTLGSSIDTTTKALNPSTTLGDIEYRSSTANTNTRLAIGTTGQVLTVSGGVPAWANNTNVEPFLVTKTTGHYYGIGMLLSATSRTATANTTVYAAIYFDGSTTFDRIGFRTFTSFSGTGVFRLGIYNASATTGLPTTVYLDAGTISATASSTNYLITINSTPPKGYYWLAANCQTAASTNTIFGITTGSGNIVNPFQKGTGGESAGAEYSYLSESVNVSSGFATAGTLTVERTMNILPFLRQA